MKISIQSLSFHVSDKLIDFAEGRISKLGRYSDKITEAHMTLRVDHSGTKHNKLCKMKLEIPGNDLLASMQSNIFFSGETKCREKCTLRIAEGDVPESSAELSAHSSVISALKIPMKHDLPTSTSTASIALNLKCASFEEAILKTSEALRKQLSHLQTNGHKAAAK